MALSLDDSTVRTALRTSIRTAWSVTRIFDDEPKTIAAASHLPRAFIFLQDTEITTGQGQSGMGQVEVPLTYEITGQFAYPASGSLEEAKVSKANLLLAQLTASASFGGGRRDVVAVRFEKTPTEKLEEAYTVTIVFRVRLQGDY